MAGTFDDVADTFDDSAKAVLTELRGWAERAGRPPGGDADEARLLLDLLHDHLGLGLTDLAVGDLSELLLEVYPRKVTVLEAEDATEVIPTVRDLLAFCRNTGRLSKAKVTRLETELEGIEPRFAGAVMDPANWGPARSLAQSMAADGVDLSDQSAVDRWISDNDHDLTGFEGAGPFDEDETLDIAEAFGLPDRLPPLRLPGDGELAEAARASVLLNRARRLADWVGERRDIADGYELEADDVADATAALGIDAGELAHVWHFAEHTEFLSWHDTYVTTGPSAGDWPSADDDEVLDTWQMALTEVLSCEQFAGVDPDEQTRLVFDGAGVAVVMALFLSRAEGIPAVELHEMIRDGATADLPPDLAERSWSAWTEEHGDPADLLLECLRDLGAVELDRPSDDAAPWVRLTPPAIWTVRLQLEQAGVDVPILPPAQEMTAADLVAVAEGGVEEEMDAELTSWVELRGAEAAADDLLRTAATGSTADRLFATTLATRIGAAAEPRWREALDDPRLRPYAKVALAGAGTPDAPAELEPAPEDLAWLLTDSIAATCPVLEPDDVAERLREALPPDERPQDLLDVMWRLDHPDVLEVLTLIGDHHPDKKIAKAARKAAFKATSRSTTRG